MYRILILAGCICAMSATPAEDIKRVGHPRIVFGEPIEIEDAPYQVSIMKVVKKNRGSHMCGGTIVSKNYILTAGHCASLRPNQYAIRSGSSSWLKGGRLHRVVKVIKHEDFAMDKFGRVSNDIGLMKVSPEFELDGKNERISELPDMDDEVETGDNAYVTGWGITEKKRVAFHLKGLNLKIMDFDECGKDYANFGHMTKYNICAEHPSGVKDMCNGDSGGPLVVKGKQVGIVSWSGPGCAVPGRPGVYVDVAKYRDWIDEHVKA